MSVLPDTSVWVEFLRRGREGSAWKLDDLLQHGDVVTCGPVVAELLAGSRAGNRMELGGLLDALPWAPLARPQWQRVGTVAAELRSRGHHVPLTDVEIAAAAMEINATLWTNDADFNRIARVVPDLKMFQ